MAYLQLGLFALISPVLTVLFYLLDHKTPFGKSNYWLKQTVYGIAFGAVAVLCTEFGVRDNGAVMNVRDSAPIAAGLIFGWPAGLISGFIGGVERFASAYWNGTFYTQWACSISTFVSGAVAALCSAIVFRKSKVNFFQALFIGMALETSHILMIFITNMNDTVTAYKYVERIGNTMITFVALSVFLSVLLIQFLHYKDWIHTIKKKKWKLATIMHVSLFATIALAYINIALYTRNIQTRISNDNAQNLIFNGVSDTVEDVKATSDSNLLSVTEEIAMVIENRNRSGHEVDDDFLYKVVANQEESGIYYAVSEINIIDSQGFIVASSGDWAKEHYNMRTGGEQSKEFYDAILVEGKKSYVQAYGPISGAEDVYMKYGAHVLEHGGFVQVGYDQTTFYKSLESIINMVATNRRIANAGFLIITDPQFNVCGKSTSVGDVSTLSELDFDTTQLTKEKPDTIYTCSVTINKEKYDCHFSYEFAEGYYVLGFMEDDEINLNRDISTYVYTYLEFIIFALIFLVVFLLIDRIILDDLDNAKEALKKISKGDLNVKIDARHSEEFVVLSESINTTVDTLKDFIAKEAERIDRELAMAKAIQLSALPSKYGFLNYHEFGIYATMQTAKEVGGDFYDYFPLDNDRFAIVVADVSGKGIPAALFMMRTKSLIKSLLETGISVNGAIQRANVQLCDNNDAKMFVTCWCGVINRKTGVVEYANAGHNPPLVRQGGQYSYLKGKVNFVLGGFASANYVKQTFTLEPGDVIFLYTDGITEAKKAENDFYGEERLINYLNNLPSINPRVITEGVIKDTLEFVGDNEQSDDMTLLTFTYYGENKDYRYEYGCEPEDYDKALKDLTDFMKEHRIAPQKREIINISFEEILTNIIKYSYVETKGKIIIHYHISSEQLSIVFFDSGKKFNPLKKDDPDVTLKAEERKIGGLGIYMVKNMVDNIYYSYQENHNILMINVLLKTQGEKK